MKRLAILLPADTFAEPLADPVTVDSVEVYGFGLLVDLFDQFN